MVISWYMIGYTICFEDIRDDMDISRRSESKSSDNGTDVAILLYAYPWLNKSAFLKLGKTQS